MIRLIAAASLATLSLAACTQPAEKTETKVVEVPSTRTVVETREVQGPPVVVEREVQVPVVVERDRRGDDSTTVRAGPDGIEVETTNR